VARVLDAIAQRAEEILSRVRDDPRGGVSEDLPAFVGLLRREPRLRATLTDIALPPEVRKEVLRSLLADKVSPATLELIGLLADEALSPQQLERAAADLAVRGILAAADADGSLEDVEDELFRFAKLIDSRPALRSALTDPALPIESKTALVRDLLAERARPATMQLVEFVIASGLERDPSHALEELADLAAARRGRVVVEARTAIPIDVQRHVRLAEALSRAVGRQVVLEVVVDPEVVGGVVARFGDELIDGSVKRKLERALEEMTA
jgi:F-type H+-transporting ATPase subunit delta